MKFWISVYSKKLFDQILLPSKRSSIVSLRLHISEEEYPALRRTRHLDTSLWHKGHFFSAPKTVLSTRHFDIPSLWQRELFIRFLFFIRQRMTFKWQEIWLNCSLFLREDAGFLRLFWFFEFFGEVEDFLSKWRILGAEKNWPFCRNDVSNWRVCRNLKFKILVPKSISGKYLLSTKSFPKRLHFSLAVSIINQDEFEWPLTTVHLVPPAQRQELFNS